MVNDMRLTRGCSGPGSVRLVTVRAIVGSDQACAAAEPPGRYVPWKS